MNSKWQINLKKSTWHNGNLYYISDLEASVLVPQPSIRISASSSFQSYFPSRLSFPIQALKGNFSILFENNPHFFLPSPTAPLSLLTYIFKTFASDLTCLFRSAIFVVREYKLKKMYSEHREWDGYIVQKKVKKASLARSGCRWALPLFPVSII